MSDAAGPGHDGWSSGRTLALVASIACCLAAAAAMALWCWAPRIVARHGPTFHLRLRAAARLTGAPDNAPPERFALVVDVARAWQTNVGSVVPYLHHPSVEVRRIVAEGLAQTVEETLRWGCASGDAIGRTLSPGFDAGVLLAPYVEPALVAAADGDSAVRFEGVYLLAYCSDPRARALVAAALTDESYHVRRAVLQAVFDGARPEVASLLPPMARDPQNDRQLLGWAAIALRKLVPGQAAGDELVAMLGDPDPAVRCAAARMLCWLGDARSERVLDAIGTLDEARRRDFRTLDRDLALSDDQRARWRLLVGPLSGDPP